MADTSVLMFSYALSRVARLQAYMARSSTGRASAGPRRSTEIISPTEVRMACRGVHFALTDVERSRLLAHRRANERLEFLQEEIEERLFDEAPDRVCETDKAWDAIHRSLTDGLLDPGRGRNPAANVILGGQSLHDRDDYIMSLKTPEQVREIAAFLASVTEERLRQGYDRIDGDEYEGTLGEEDFGYVRESLQQLRQFYERAAKNGDYVLFTVDQ